MTINNFICCPVCHSSLILDNFIFNCQNNQCLRNYRSIENIPLLVDYENKLFNFVSLSNNPTPFFKNNSKLFAFLKKLVPDISHNIAAKKNFKYISSKLISSDARVLIIGAGNGGIGVEILESLIGLQIIKTDVYVKNSIDYICDAHSLPFIDCSFDLVVIQAVLEHVIYPNTVINEIYRVLKNSGFVYSEVPFIQQVHGAEYDFTRWTRSGHRHLFAAFKEIKSGQIASVGTSLAWSIEYFISGIIKAKTIRILLIVLSRYFTFIFKYFDYIAIGTNYNRSADGSSGFYFLGKKSITAISDSEIISYYL